MPQLFDPAKIGSLDLPNRLVRSATWEGMCDADGRPTPRLIDCYRELAAGGVGLIISGYTFVRSDGRQLPGKMGIDEDGLVPDLRRLTDAVHAAGGRIFCQLVHAGGQTSAKTIGCQPVAPSAVESPNFPEIPRELSISEIADLVAAFAAGARRAREAGFDGVQLHAAHGYLINQFLSPLTNCRGDDYGGSLENRRRFLLEVFAAVAAAVGAGFPVTAKLTASDHLDGGLTLEEALAAARDLDRLGIDAIEVSSGTAASGTLGPVRTNIRTEADEAYNAEFARAMRQALKAPVMSVGGVRSPAVASRLIEQGDADFVSLSRPLIRQPDLPARWQRGERGAATCISCNGCFRPGLKEGGIYCVVDRRGTATA